MSIELVKVPDVGDADAVEVIEICVAVGDRVAVDDALVVIESDKASMDIPSPVAGVIKGIRVKEGDQVGEGDPVVEIELDAGDAPDQQEASDAGQAPAAETGQDAAPEREPAPAQDDAPAAAADAGTRTEEVRVPDVGDAGEVTVVEIMVAVGDSVEADDGLVALESDKATMEVPAPAAGRVLSIDVAEGDVVGEGTLVARLEVAGAAPAAPSEPAAAPAAPERSEPVAAPARPAPSTTGSAQPEAAAQTGGASVYAGPAVRRLARELGVDLSRVPGSGHRGRIVKEDVHGFVKDAMQGRAPQTAAAEGAGIPAVPEQDFSKFGEIEIVDESRLLRTGARNLHRSWLNVPHVTQHDEADVTDLEAFRRSLKPEAERRGSKLTPLPLLMRAVQASLKEFPRFNGSFTSGGERYVYKRYFHVGFAVDTPEGLLVPVIRDVDQKGIWELADEITELSGRARELKLKPDEMRGACFTISSLGALGGTGFTPIVNAPEVAILGVSRLTRKPVWQDGEFVPRDMLPLSLSYDHRAINGAEAGRFMTWLCQALGDLRRVLL